MKVLLLHTAGLHLGYLGCYGSEWVDTSHLDQLAARSVVFDSHFADWLPTSPTLWTGHPGRPGPGLDERLQQAGIPCTRISAAEQGNSWERVVKATRSAMKKKGDANLVWVDLPTLLPPWNIPSDFLEIYFEESEDPDAKPLGPVADCPPERLDRADLARLDQLQRSYAGVVGWFDEGLGLLLEKLDGPGLLQDWLLILTASRGLALGEHGQFGDLTPCPHEEVAHLPLLMRWPDTRPESCRIPALTQPADVFATILGALELAEPTCPGSDLRRLRDEEAKKGRDYAVTGWRVPESAGWALRTRDWSLLLPPSTSTEQPAPQLFVRPDDRWEMSNVRQQHLELAEQLEQVLRQCSNASAQPGAPWPALGELQG